MKHVLAVAAAVVGLAACGASGGKRSAVMHKPVELPVVMHEDRFFLETTTATGSPLRIYLDSAGGMFLTRKAVDRLKLPVKHLTEGDDDGGVDTVEFPKFFDARVPRPMMEAFPVLPAGEEPVEGADGMLGAPWFAGRVFTFDYAGRRMWLRAPGDLPQVAAAHRIPVGMKRDEAGELAAPYGRIQIEVDGAAIEMLFDTGATVVLTPEARQQLGGTATERATSFITETVFERWRKAHPAWRVIEAADRTGPTTTDRSPVRAKQGSASPWEEGPPRGLAGAPMIEVPEVRIAGHTVGPVWFTRRPDAAFHDFMARMMDKPSDGAVGGSALRHFQRVTVDWANAVAVFEK